MGNETNSMSKVFLTGDTHGNFYRISEFINNFSIFKDDIIIVLGDSGINYNASKKDFFLKTQVNNMGCKFFFIDGNHEKPAYNISSYEKTTFFSGTALVEKDFPNIIFAMPGEIYNIYGLKTIVISGAYSVD